MSEDMVVRSLFKSVQEERDMWQDRAEAAEARAEANFQALQESEADLARTQARAEAAEARVRELEKQVVRAKMDFDGRPTNFAQAEVSLNTDIIKSLEVRAEAAEAKLHELSVKYTVALDQNREMREALEDIERSGGTYWAVERARAVLASRQPDNE
jgi:chromosome segregation ATPase